MKEFRTLTADEIEVRVGTVGNGKASLLLYKDARCDMNILDETVGPMNWQKSYELIDGQLFCTIDIWDDEKKQWISKQDVGVESNTEAEKGRASDAQKRAAVAAGIGRELYTAPRITIKCETVQEGNRHKLKYPWQFYGCKVESISYDDRRQITQLTITKDENVIYEYPDSGEHTRAIPPQPLTRDEMRDKIKALAQIKELSRADVEAKYGRPLSEFSKAELEDCLNWLKEL